MCPREPVLNRNEKRDSCRTCYPVLANRVLDHLMPDSLLKLPEEILLQIACFLDVLDILSLKQARFLLHAYLETGGV